MLVQSSRPLCSTWSQYSGERVLLYRSCPHSVGQCLCAPCLAALCAPLVLCCVTCTAVLCVQAGVQVCPQSYTCPTGETHNTRSWVARAELHLGAVWPVHLTRLLSQARAHVCVTLLPWPSCVLLPQVALMLAVIANRS